MLSSLSWLRGRLLSPVTRLVAVLIAFTLLTIPSAHAKYAAFVMDAESGQILHTANPDTRNYPASLTKMMTLYLIFEALDTGKITLKQRFRASARAARQPSSKLALNRGETISVQQVILALVTKSANDVATMVAEELGGTERSFALIMTAKARQLGMSRTTFRKASGLPHSGQTTTARDMATLARRLLIDYPHYYHHFSTAEFNYNGARHRNHNKLLKKYSGTDGIKTGYIRASGFNLVASVVRNGHRLIGVVLGGRSPRARDRHMMALLDKSFRKLGGSVLVARNHASQSPKRATKSLPRKTAPLKTVRRTGTRTDKPISKPLNELVPSDKSNEQLTQTPTTAWAIQVGAYSRFTQAMHMATKMISKFPKHLKDGTARVDPLKLRRKSRPVYRARIVGLEKRQAYRACDQLKRSKIDCMEVRLKDLQLAFASE